MTRNGVYSQKINPLTRVKRGIRRRWREFSGYSKKKKAAIVGGPILAFLIVVPIVTYVYYYNDISNEERLMNRNNTGVVLLDSKGRDFYDVGRAQHRQMVPLSSISKDMQNALIASEDKDFYKNQGFSPTGILRALFLNVTSGSIQGGGSTITQQLAKNTLLSTNQTFLRKYQELTVAIAIDQHYSKDQILDMYLNSVFFGGTTFGVQEASKFYFNTTPDKLDLAQSAMLVGVLPAPNAYSPTLGSLTYAKERQKTVLSRMVKNGYISQSQADAAYSEELQYAAPSDGSEDSQAPFFAQMVLDKLYKKYGQEKVLRSGFQVKTTLDLDMQNQLNHNVQNHMKYIQMEGGSNASAIAIDPSTGNIKALVGSADYSNPDWGKVNMVTTARQPGSSFKTIYYTGALENGTITPATILQDKPTTFTGNYAPLDADRRWRGDVTVRQAINQSLNVPSVEVMQKYGIPNAVSYAKKLGISSLNSADSYGLALALGAAEAPLDQMTNAYATIANGGTYRTPQLIMQIDDKFDKVIDKPSETGTRAVDENAAYLISNVLSDQSARAPIFGSSLVVQGHSKVAVKTGTTNDDRDAWTIGYTPHIAVGVWVGNNDNEQMSSGGADMAGPIWRNSMADFLQGQTAGDPFTKPSGVVQKPVCYGTGNIAPSQGSNTYNEYFMTLHIPSGSCNTAKKQVKISVCDLANQTMTEIDQDNFDDTKYSKDPSACDKKQTEQSATVQVCDTTTGQVVTLPKNQATDTQYSGNTANCQAKQQTIQVCDLTTGQVVTIDQSAYDSSRYSKDTTNCTTTTPPTTPTTPGTGTGGGNGSGNGARKQ